MKKKLTFYVLLICFIFIMAGCIDNLRGPSWNTTARLPLTASSVSISEILEDAGEDINIPETDDPINYSFEFDYDTFGVETLNITLDNITSDSEIGAITISDLLNLEDSFDSIPSGTNLSGQAPLIIALDDVDAVSFQSGNMEITVTNEFATETLQDFKLTLDGLGTVEFDDMGGNIGPGISGTDQIDLSGKTISDNIEITVEGSVSGDGTEFGSIKVELKIDQATVTSIEGLDNINQSINQNVQLDLGITDISEMEIEDGSFDIDITSPAGSNLAFTISSIDLNGTTLSSIGTGYDLSGIIISGHIISLDVEGTLENDDPGNPVSINATDKFGIDISFSELTLSSLTAELQEEVELDEQRVELGEFPQEIDGVQLRDLDVKVVIENNSQSKMDFGNLFVTSVSGDQNPPTIGGAGEAVVDANDTGEFQIGHIVLDIINEHPDELFIGGKVTIGDGSETTITKYDNYVISVNGSVPFSVDIPENGISYKLDAEEIDTSELEMDSVTDYIDSGNLHMFVGNNFPVSIEASIYFSDDEGSLYDAHNKEYTLIVNAGQTDTNGKVTAETSNSIDLSLDSSTLDLFENDPVYMGVEIEIPNETGSPMAATLTSANYIRFSAYAEMTVKVNQRGDM